MVKSSQSVSLLDYFSTKEKCFFLHFSPTVARLLSTLLRGENALVRSGKRLFPPFYRLAERQMSPMQSPIGLVEVEQRPLVEVRQSRPLRSQKKCRKSGSF